MSESMIEQAAGWLEALFAPWVRSLGLRPVIKPGRTLFFGEVQLIGAGDGKLAAHATTTYAMV